MLREKPVDLHEGPKEPLGLLLGQPKAQDLEDEVPRPGEVPGEVRREERIRLKGPSLLKRKRGKVKEGAAGAVGLKLWPLFVRDLLAALATDPGVV
jgi:hypothetical protein